MSRGNSPSGPRERGDSRLGAHLPQRPEYTRCEAQKPYLCRSTALPEARSPTLAPTQPPKARPSPRPQRAGVADAPQPARPCLRAL